VRAHVAAVKVDAVSPPAVSAVVYTGATSVVGPMPWLKTMEGMIWRVVPAMYWGLTSAEWGAVISSPVGARSKYESNHCPAGSRRRASHEVLEVVQAAANWLAWASAAA
jgi:hypothetical protein